MHPARNSPVAGKELVFFKPPDKLEWEALLQGRKMKPKSRSRNFNVGCDPLNNSIFLRGEITAKTPALVNKALQRILRGDPELLDWLFLFINSPGGLVNPTHDIWHLLENRSQRLITIADHNACSGAILLLQLGAYRFATPETDFLMHALYESPQQISGDIDDRWLLAKLEETLTDNAIQLIILTIHGQPYDAIKRLFHEKILFGSRLAKKLSLINDIIPAAHPALLRKKALEQIGRYRRLEKKRRLP